MKTTHNLQFEVTNWRELDREVGRLIERLCASGNIRKFLVSITGLNEHNKKVQLFRVGTCSGVWYPTPEEYRILFICNSQKGNGHFEDVIEWFQASCKRDKRDLVFEEVLTERLKKHLEKRGFIRRENDMIKSFKKIP